MDERLLALIDQTSEKPPRSKLEPHLELIRVLRRRRQTYQDIARFFAEHLNMTVAASTIHAFVQVRARSQHRRPPIALPPQEQPRTETARAAVNDGVTAGTEADMRRRIETLKGRRLPEKSTPRFEYKESEPLQLARGNKQEG